MSQKVLIIGGGIGGLAAAGLLAKAGYQVTLVEKNKRLGGRANVFERDGFRFDMGPSWYLMPDVFEHFYELMGTHASNELQLQQLDPSYKISFRGDPETVEMFSDLERDIPTFEAIEPGSGDKLRAYLAQAERHYDIAIKHFMYKNYDSLRDVMNFRMAIEGSRLNVFKPMHKHVSRSFKTEKLQKIMEYQQVFLGSSPYNTPALYSIMSHIDFNMGVFYPKGGIYSIVESLRGLAEAHGARLLTDAPVKRIIVENGLAHGIELENGDTLTADIIISNADMYHTETSLLPVHARQYSESYWQSRTLAPSGFIMYLGLKDRVPGMVHHNLAFGRDWRRGFADIFDNPQWPSDPSYYVCAPSKTDSTVAPDGKENLFILVPVATSLPMDADSQAQYREKVLDLMEKDFGVTDIRSRIEFERVYTSNDFTADYNAFGGSALGLAHTLRQTALFRPSNISRKVSNLYYVGAGTSPGIGMPICLISAELAYKRITGDKSAEPLKSL